MDATSQQVHVQPPYYFYGQITKFVEVGSVRVETTETFNTSISALFGGVKEETNVEVFRCGPLLGTQRWDINQATNEVKLHGTTYCMDDMNLGTQNGSNTQVYTCTGGSNQKWKYQNGRFVNQYNGLCLAIQRWENDNGANVYQVACSDNDITQRWTFTGSINTQIVSAVKADDGSNLCLQAGRLAINSVGFETPEGRNVLVVQNTGLTSVNFKLYNTRTDDIAANLTIPERSIATYLF